MEGGHPRIAMHFLHAVNPLKDGFGRGGAESRALCNPHVQHLSSTWRHVINRSRMKEDHPRVDPFHIHQSVVVINTKKT